jgi:hypothetical protein
VCPISDPAVVTTGVQCHKGRIVEVAVDAPVTDRTGVDPSSRSFTHHSPSRVSWRVSRNSHGTRASFSEMMPGETQ